MEQLVIILALYFFFYQISGLATTNILRLTAGSTLPVLSSECRCDNCGARITPLMQMPIFSYLACGGRCRSCGIEIPAGQLRLEIAVFAGMSLIATIFRYSLAGVSLSFGYYEVVRIIVLRRLGRRERDFAKQYAIALLAMIPHYLLTLFVALLYRIL